MTCYNICQRNVVLKQSVTQKVLITERKKLRRMFGPTNDSDDTIHEKLKEMTS